MQVKLNFDYLKLKLSQFKALALIFTRSLNKYLKFK